MKFAEFTLESNKSLKIFLSFSDEDNRLENPNIETFRKHIAPLKKDGLIEELCEISIFPDMDLLEESNSKIDNPDIICLFLSSNYLSSDACLRQKKKAMELKKWKNVQIISIILSPCSWKEDPDISKLEVFPIDGHPIIEFSDKKTAWENVCEGVRRIAEYQLKVKRLKIREDFNFFLHDAELLTKAHPKKQNITLADVYVETELEKFNNFKDYKKNKETIRSDELLKNLFTEKKIILSGEYQSGKTTLCKKIFLELRQQNFIPVYLSSKKGLIGQLENIISRTLREQYIDIDETLINFDQIIPIIDDFHDARNREKHLKSLEKYTHCAIFVDDIFGLDLKDEKYLLAFTYFKVKELKPSLINDLIIKWVSLTGKDGVSYYKDIDKDTELIYSTLGKNLGKGILPAYPFFIISTIVTYETFTLSLDQEITSQGHLYQAFIYFYLLKRGVKYDDIDIYLNFLTEISFHIYNEKMEEINEGSFTHFMKAYTTTYNLPISQNLLVDNMNEIFIRDKYGNYSFRYSCFYYYFVAKFLSEHMENIEIQNRIKDILNNLHVDENAYIAVFLTHHSKNDFILKILEQIASSLFDKYIPATLTKSEMKFFDEKIHIILKASLPPANVTPDEMRKNDLYVKDKLAQSQNEEEQVKETDNNPLIKDMRRAIRTVEVLGCIIRNRAGSLEKEKLKSLFLCGMNIHLRILSSFFELIKSEESQQEIIEYFSLRLKNMKESADVFKQLEYSKQRKMAYNIFWNMNFNTLLGILYKVIHSLGSDKLTDIVKISCDEIDNPASFIIKEGIIMNYTKNIDISMIQKRIDEKNFSEVGKRAAHKMIVDYCSLNLISYRQRKQIEDYLRIQITDRPLLKE